MIQLNEIMEQLPPEVHESVTFKDMSSQVEIFLHTNGTSESSVLPESLESDHQTASDTTLLINESSDQDQNMEDQAPATAATDLPHDDSSVPQDSNRSSISNTTEAAPRQSSENESKTSEASTARNDGEKEIIEQFEPGVYVTFIQRPSGTKIFKRVRFRYLVTAWSN